MTDDIITISPGSRLRAAMILAMAADAVQIFVFPLFAEGALSPADDVLDLAVAAVLVRLIGWHWEFLPAFAAELVPGVDLVPFWTLAVASVYRKSKKSTITTEEAREQRPALRDPTTFVSRESDDGRGPGNISGNRFHGTSAMTRASTALPSPKPGCLPAPSNYPWR